MNHRRLLSIRKVYILNRLTSEVLTTKYLKKLNCSIKIGPTTFTDDEIKFIHLTYDSILLGIDSIELAEIQVDLEENFKIKITAEEMKELCPNVCDGLSILKLVDLLDKKDI